ncbi:MAG: hypothetical protein MUE40_05670 [Anaerolineae bacterium]|nr:hypothetical protein [Anaerolineae bacterium]
MAYLNKQERDQLLEELRGKHFARCQRLLVLKDPKIRLKYFRNNQEVDRFMTRYVLGGMGTQVTLVESLHMDGEKRVFTLQEIIVEPTPDNRL